MAIDLQATNGTVVSTHERYYTAPDHSTWDITASTDFTLYGVVYPQDNAATKYWFSNGAYQAANSLNMIAYEGVSSNIGFAAAYSGNEVNWGNGDITLDRYYVHYISVRSGLIYCGASEMGGAISAEGTGSTFTSAVNPTGLVNIGRRQGGDITRYWRGRIDRFGLNIGYGATLLDIDAIAAGTLPSASALGSNGTLVERANFTSATPATITGLEAGQVFTRQGSGYGANETSPFGGAAVKGFTLTLHDITPTAHANLTNVDIVYYDVPDPENITTSTSPIKVILKTNLDASGVITVNVNAETALNINDNGYALVSVKDGTDHRDSLRFQSRVTIADIS